MSANFASTSATNPPPSPDRVRLKGLFDNGTWKCNCEPRMPATFFEVKKEGPNKGRWFYACQFSPPQRCGFFLWDDDAKARSRKAVLANSRSEPLSSSQEREELVRKQRQAYAMPAPASPSKQVLQRGTARRYSLADDGFELATEDEEALISFADSAAATASAVKPGLGSRRSRKITYGDDPHEPRTPRRSPTKQEKGFDSIYKTAPSTPDRASFGSFGSRPGHSLADSVDIDLRQLQEGYGPLCSTPSKRGHASLEKDAADGLSYVDNANADFSQPRPKKQGSPTRPQRSAAPPESSIYPTIGGFSTANAMGLMSPAETPSNHIRFRDALAISSPSQTPRGSSLISRLPTEVFQVLEEHAVQMSPAAEEALRNLCNLHVRRAQGVEKGRDVARVAIKTRNDMIEECKKTVEERGRTIEKLNEELHQLRAQMEAMKRVHRSNVAARSLYGGEGQGASAGSANVPGSIKDGDISSGSITDSSYSEEDEDD